MKIKRGDYPGASEFAYFDKDVREMDLEECRSLLEHVLHRAAPGHDNAEMVYRELSIAEQCWKESGAERPSSPTRYPKHKPGAASLEEAA